MTQAQLFALYILPFYREWASILFSTQTTEQCFAKNLKESRNDSCFSNLFLSNDFVSLGFNFSGKTRMHPGLILQSLFDTVCPHAPAPCSCFNLHPPSLPLPRLPLLRCWVPHHLTLADQPMQAFCMGSII